MTMRIEPGPADDDNRWSCCDCCTEQHDGWVRWHDQPCDACQQTPPLTGCGGCAGLGAHTRWCPTVVGARAHRFGTCAKPRHPDRTGHPMTDSPGPKDDQNRWACCDHCDNLPPHRRDDHDAPCPACQEGRL